MIEEWLTRAERRVKAVNEIGFKRLLEEGNAHKSRLVELGTSGAADGARVTHLNGRIEEFLHYVKTRMNRSHRIQAFFQSAQTELNLLYVTNVSEKTVIIVPVRAPGEVSCNV
ncbi:hypothetical protein ANCCAN_20345 [Ancylostoma caninum]|uniref:Uncharacterized protein n=1 Tax=Ancylostoma caninum TaxID=29170 RepID=A0A368FP21_ANCCA|nr:hypothetical protein ANCCAN_20345 [Ancylostoma caninum]